MYITIGNRDSNLLINFGSGYSIINLSLANYINFNCNRAKLSEEKLLKFFSNDTVITLGTLKLSGGKILKFFSNDTVITLGTLKLSGEKLLKFFSNDTVITLGTLKTPVKPND